MTSVRDGARLHDIYRMRDLSGRLLYIGVTNGGLRRFMEHSKDKTWWREVAQIDVEHVHCSRSVIEAIERDAIQTERPLYNVAHNSYSTPAVVEPYWRKQEHHYCDPSGDNCPTPTGISDRLRPRYEELSSTSRRWIGEILVRRASQRRMANWAQGAAQTAVLVLIAENQIEPSTDPMRAVVFASSELEHIMNGGWGAPVDAFHEVSAGDCLCIMRMHFDPDAVESIGYPPGVEICDHVRQAVG